MERNPFIAFDPYRVTSPCHVVEENELIRNLEILKYVQDKSGARILLALKAFAMFHFAPLISQYLYGVCASGLHEAKLGREEFKGEVHTYGAGYRTEDMADILSLSDHVVFNSVQQWRRFKKQIQTRRETNPQLQIGIRINPECSVSKTPIYDPSAPFSRMGTRRSEFDHIDTDELDGLHFHNLCEQTVEPLRKTIAAVEEKFGHCLHKMKWINFGGGHHITRSNYEVEELIDIIRRFSDKYGVRVYLEPGEAVAWSIGMLVSEILDIVHNEKSIAIMDTSAIAHMPDIIEAPYTPEITFAGGPDTYKHQYRIGGPTCLTGDVMGDYSFKNPLRVGQRLIFTDMAYYTMVKTTEFNGIIRPAMAVWNNKTDTVKMVKRFDYQNYKMNLS